jgi:hypothetical protein
MSTKDGRYTDKSVSDASFKQDKSFLKPSRAAAGENNAQGGIEGWDCDHSAASKATDSKVDVDKFTGNDGGERKRKSWQ